MLFRLLLLFTIVPLVELWILIKVGRIIGAWPTVFLVAATGFGGVLLARSQGLKVLYNFRRELELGALPADELLDGVCILLGGAFLLTPGLLTDLLGLGLLLPYSRQHIKVVLKRLIKNIVGVGAISYYRRR